MLLDASSNILQTADRWKSFFFRELFQEQHDPNISADYEWATQTWPQIMFHSTPLSLAFVPQWEVRDTDLTRNYLDVN